ncbi:peptidoglycan-binding protein [Maritimibacter sp. 55A14]|uniref:serine protease n=1 Tax=Maritimibacter sp. 55A14 TaxID=2174844 RepID=UPI000D620B4E|nr:serine protease [Maritimibacter sp. 55A14]PWE33877.1 peptidoglycan-binding protein [Maritimibacter sp. 55A14]
MKNFVLSVLCSVLYLCAALPDRAAAQDTAWIQVEAHPDLRTARERARIYATELDRIHAFRMTTGWYAIAIGPLSAPQAEDELQFLRRSGAVPGDSYVVDGGQYRRQFWPMDAQAGTTAADQAAEVTEEAPEVPAATVEDTAPAALPDETPREARANERRLSAEERRDLQRALQWFGFYSAGIDGAFGPGTRRSMAAWQEANRHEPTGILTTRQRAELMENYTRVIARLGMADIRDEAAGIEIRMPTALVAFDRYEAPFAHYEPKTQGGVRVALISQEGNRATLHGLYEIMQTLEIVPLEGPRHKDRDSFLLTGRNDEIASYTHARLVDGAVKGFTLIWPRGMDTTMERVSEIMRESFTAIPGQVLDDARGVEVATQSVDLMAGLEIRKPERARSGFYVDDRGTVLTSLDAARQCGRITIDNAYEAELALSDAELGIAVLRPKSGLAPMGHAAFTPGTPRLRSEIAVAGYSYAGLLGAPTLTFGTLADIQGLSGEPNMRRLAVLAQPGDTGGPVLDTGGAVVGLLMPRDEGDGKQLPEDVRFASAAEPIADLLRENGIEVKTAEPQTSMAPEDLTVLASHITVLVSCWN